MKNVYKILVGITKEQGSPGIQGNIKVYLTGTE
jgi:hypothetical protein